MGVWSGAVEAGTTTKPTGKMEKKSHPQQSSGHKYQTTSPPSHLTETPFLALRGSFFGNKPH